ncbi:hypothetical protein CEXT_699701 [Caerostris extrusa]|uniref:DDE Tnp4 domain-containing protein n=1 Tax=Caerostris extrusa TaxID=172846 RepID=A0AAV4TAB2_CAEEX|nr:hypothetical protein CEXT_699701 [Caerostris extrusa]
MAISNCIGSIDGKQVLIQAPLNTRNQYYNYKETLTLFCSPVWMLATSLCFLILGRKAIIATVVSFRNSVTGQTIECNKINISNSAALLSTKTIMPFVFVGDEAFPLRTI